LGLVDALDRNYSILATPQERPDKTQQLNVSHRHGKGVIAVDVVRQICDTQIQAQLGVYVSH
jgi:hypothetical protein